MPIVMMCLQSRSITSPSKRRSEIFAGTIGKSAYWTKVEHPNIIRILDYDLLDEFCYLVMPYYPDRSMMQTHPVFSAAQDIHYGRNSFMVNDTIPSFSPATIDDTLRFIQYLLDALHSVKAKPRCSL